MGVKTWLREESHGTEQKLGDFEKRVERGLTFVENKYGVSKKDLRKKFYSVYHKLSPDQRLHLRSYIYLSGMSVLPITTQLTLGVYGLASFIAPIAFGSSAIIYETHKILQEESKKKLHKVI